MMDYAMNAKDFDDVDYDEIQAKGETWDKYREHLFEEYTEKFHIEKDKSYAERLKPPRQFSSNKDNQKERPTVKMFFEENFEKGNQDQYKKY